MKAASRPQRFFAPVDWLAFLALFVVQAWLVLPLFSGQFTQFRGSIEATFIANARFIVDHFPDLSWNPDWYLGFPFELFYTPLLPAIVAVIGKVIDDVPHAYRLVSAFGLALGPAALYLAAHELTRSRRAALLAAIAFIFLPSAAYVFPTIREDAQAFSGALAPPPWHLAALVEYGEGPHVLALSLALLAVAAVLRYLHAPSSTRLALAVAALVAVALTNLIGALGVAVLFFGIALSRDAAVAVPQKLQRLRPVAILTVLFSLGWYSVGFMSAFARPSGGDTATTYILLPVVFGAALLIDGRLRGVQRLPQGASVVAVWLFIFAAIVILKQVFGVAVAPQPIRYALELDVVFALALGIAAAFAIERLGSGDHNLALSTSMLVAILLGLGGWIAVQPRLAPDLAWRGWSEHQVAVWLEDHLGPGERAFLSGDHGFWLNVFVGAPQVRGGQDFSAIDPWPAHAAYQITAGNDAAISLLWLQALGVHYLVVPGTTSNEIFRDFNEPSKFEGKLPVVYDSAGVRIYEVPPAGDPRAVVLLGPMGLSAPTNGIDRPALEAYVHALSASTKPSAAATTGLGHVELTVDPADSGTVVLRQSYDSGWRATIDGRGTPVTADALGFASAEVAAGRHVVVFDHGPHRDFLLGLVVASLTGLALSVRRLRPLPRLRVARHVALDAIVGGSVVASVVGVGTALTAWSGFPKGVDAYQHLTRLKFVADWFPHHDWFYAWAAGMPMFDNYPGLAYVSVLPLVRLFGEVWALEFIALAAMLAFALGLYGHLRTRTGDARTAGIATAMVVTSMAIWHFITASGVYARVAAMGFGGLAWWAHAKALEGKSGKWWALTAILIAATIASHPVTGAFVAGYIAIVQLSTRGLGGIRPLFALGALSFLLAAQPIISSVGFGVGGTILGVDRPELGYSDPSELIAPQYTGFVALLVPALVVVLQLRRRFWRAVGAGVGLLGVVAYMFAPNLHVPTRYYYINGIDPATAIYFLAIVGGLAFAALAPSLPGGIRRVVYVGTTALVVVNAILGVQAMYAFQFVNDTSLPTATEQIARRSLASVDGADLRHRIAPLSATESVLFNYFAKKPELRDYYAFAQLNVDWLYWAYDTLYHPPINPARYQAVLDWYGLDELTVSQVDTKGEADIAALDFMRLDPDTRNTQFRLYRYLTPSTLAALTAAPLTVVVADRSGYDRTARLLFDAGASPRTRVPIWWSETLATLPDELTTRASAVLIVGDRLGDPTRAAARTDELTAHGAKLVWDVGDLAATATLPAPWPAERLQRVVLDRWDVVDRGGRIRSEDFSAASYDGEPWGASAPAGARGTVELSASGQPIIVSSARGQGTLTILGGNLLYHAQSKANAAERGYVLSFLGPPANGAEREPVWRFVDPERREIESDGTAVVLKESRYAKWQAHMIDADGRVRTVPIFYAGPGLMLVLPPAAGTVIFEYDSTLPSGWIAWGLTVLGGAIAIFLARRESVFVPAPRASRRVDSEDE